MAAAEGGGNYGGEERAKASIGKIDGYRDPHPFTAPVGSYNPNKLGLYDLGGNAYEWCEDQYSSSSRVLRGACWDILYHEDLLSSNRNHNVPARRNDSVGFRVVVEGVGER